MPVSIVEAEARHAPAVAAFNARMAAAGSPWRFYEQPEPEWLAADGSSAIERRHYLAVDGDMVHGGYVLKRQPFWLDGALVEVGHVQGPVSEGIIDRRHAMLGPLMTRDSLQRLPLQFVWGPSGPKASMLERAGWRGGLAPLLLRAVDPAGLARAIGGTGRSMRAVAARLAAATGVASLGAALLQGAIRLADGSASAATAIEEERFTPWAEPLAAPDPRWRLAARRTPADLDRILPTSGWPHARPLRIILDGRTIGAAALRVWTVDRRIELGTFRAAVVADALALPGHAGDVALAVTRHLATLPVDLAGAAFSDPLWQQAFRGAGWLPVRGRRRLMLSPALARRLGDVDATGGAVHLTLADGDGPRLF